MILLQGMADFLAVFSVNLVVKEELNLLLEISDL